MRGEEKYHHLQHHHQNHHLLRSFHLHAMHLGHRHGHEKGKSPATTMPPKGWVGIRVGQEGEEQQRFEVPVDYLKHPLFMALLHQAKEEFGYEQSGAITIPCGVDHFRHVRDTINRDSAATAAAHHHSHLPHLAGCFGA